jgi:hypothetical protein
VNTIIHIYIGPCYTGLCERAFFMSLDNLRAKKSRSSKSQTKLSMNRNPARPHLQNRLRRCIIRLGRIVGPRRNSYLHKIPDLEPIDSYLTRRQVSQCAISEMVSPVVLPSDWLAMGKGLPDQENAA